MLRIAVIGATGRIGRPLCRELTEAGHVVTVVSRDPTHAAQIVRGAAGYVAWRPDGAEFRGLLGAIDAVVYLAGAPLFDGRRHTREDVEAESRARVAALGRLGAALGDLDGRNGLGRRPATLVAASSVGYYGYSGRSDALIDESSPAGADWWGRDSAAIEDAARKAGSHGVRTVLLRTGYVLTGESLGGQVAQFRHHFGGWIGSGRGWTPWIHIADVTGIIRFALEHQDIDGALNLTAPAPVRGRDFATVLGQVLGRRAWLPVPSPLVRMGLGVITDILVRGKRVIPATAASAGYQFLFPDAAAALGDLVASGDGNPAAAGGRQDRRRPPGPAL